MHFSLESDGSQMTIITSETELVKLVTSPLSLVFGRCSLQSATMSESVHEGQAYYKHGS